MMMRKKVMTPTEDICSEVADCNDDDGDADDEDDVKEENDDD